MKKKREEAEKQKNGIENKDELQNTGDVKQAFDQLN